MSGRFEHFDARPGGSYRLVLTYADASTGAGKATADSDITDARFVDIVPGVRVVQAVDFVADDPDFAGTMTMTWEVSATDEGTRVDIRADDVPAGISAEDHAVGPGLVAGEPRRVRPAGRQRTSVTWSDVAGPDLDVATLYDVLALRSAVFVVEQECAYQDLDGLDLLEGTRHLIGRQGDDRGVRADPRAGSGAEHGLPPGEQPEMSTPRIGRVIVAPQARGQQLGRRVIERAVRSCEQHWPGQADRARGAGAPRRASTAASGSCRSASRTSRTASRTSGCAGSPSPERRPYPCRVLMLLAPRYWGASTC